MLQIISGRFFSSEERYTTPAKGILYSNYSWVLPIETAVGTFEPVDRFGAVTGYVLSYVNQIEKEPGSGIIAVGESEIVREFHLLAMLGLRAHFGPERTTVLANCRPRAISSHEPYVPSRFVDRILDPQLHGTRDEVTSFVTLVEKALCLPRAKYLALIGVLDALDRALQAINGSLDLAYSLIVYALESLAQKFDDYQPQWSDYDQQIRGKLDKVLESEPQLGTKVRGILVETSHLKLNTRFRDFVETHMSNDFYVARARGKKSPLRPSQLRQALKHAYELRSGYVHRLESIREQLHHPMIGEFEVFTWEGEPYLTLRGLLSVTFHVIKNFVSRGETLAREEEVNWRARLPGVMHFEVAPQHWNWDPAGITELPNDKRAPRIRQYFEGLLQLVVAFATRGEKVVDIHDLLGVYEKLLAGAKKQDRDLMLATYVLFNTLLGPGAMPQSEGIVKKHQKDIQRRSIEFLVIELILCDRVYYDDDYNACVCAYEEYAERRFAAATPTIPVLLEIKLLCALANMAHVRDASADRERFLARAMGEAAGIVSAQELIAGAQTSGALVDLRAIVTLPREPRTEEPAGDKPTANEAAKEKKRKRPQERKEPEKRVNSPSTKRVNSPSTTKKRAAAR